MADSTNRILWKFFGDTKNLDKAMGKTQKGFKQTNKATSAMQSGIGLATRAVGALGIALGGREILQWGKDAINAANDYEESLNAIKVVAGDAAIDIRKLGETSAESFALSKTELNEAAVAFAAFGEQINKDDLGGVFEEYTTRAADFASVMTIGVDEAMQKFRSGLAGESEPLRQFGIDMSAAAVTAEAYATGIADAGKKLTEQQKVQARYSLLLKQTNKMQGDFANTADSAANKSKILTARFKDMQVEVGRKLQPAFEDLLTVTESLAPALSDVAVGFASALAESVEFTRGLAVAADESLTLGERASGMNDAFNNWAEWVIKTGGPATWLLQKALTEATSASERLEGGADRVRRSWEELQTDRYAGDMRNLTSATGEAAAASDDLAEASDRIAAAMGRARSAFSGDLFRDYREQQRLDPLFAGGGGSGQENYATGGVVPGQRGKARLAVVHGGEMISTPMQQGGGPIINVTFSGIVGDPVEVAAQIQDLLDVYGRTNGLQ